MRPGSSEVEEHQIGEIEYLLQYKRIRRMYLRLKPQESKVFVTAPYRTPLSEVEQFVSRNREWIRRQKEKQKLRTQADCGSRKVTDWLPWQTV